MLLILDTFNLFFLPPSCNYFLGNTLSLENILITNMMSIYYSTRFKINPAGDISTPISIYCIFNSVQRLSWNQTHHHNFNNSQWPSGTKKQSEKHSNIVFCHCCMLYKDNGQGLDNGSCFITEFFLGWFGVFFPVFFFINRSISVLSSSWRIFAAMSPSGTCTLSVFQHWPLPSLSDRVW